MTESKEKNKAAIPIAASPPTTETPKAEVIGTPAKEHGRLYWLWKNIVSGPKSFARNHWVKFALLILLLLVVLFSSRGYYHGFIITCRQYFGGVVTSIGLIAFLIWWLKRAKSRARMLTIIIIAVLSWPVYECFRPVHDYFALWLRYRTLKIVEIPDWPITRNERVQPLRAVPAMASMSINDNETPTDPHFVRIEGQYHFTLGLEPSDKMPMEQYLGGINRIFDVPGTKPDLEFEKAATPVSFEVGENLKWGRNYKVAVCRALGPWRYLNCDADQIIYLKNDEGQWVQVVPLIHWRNWLFPWKEFGGVVVIEQSPNGILQSIRRTFVGCGHFIPPDKIKDYPFLMGQNILSYQVSRFMANSFRFRNGFLAPMPGFHRGDTRIPDMKEDANDLPFTIDAMLSEFGGRDILHHFFALEPYNTNSRGLCLSLFIPADGENIVYINISQSNKQLMGVTSVAAVVTNTFKFYDSSHIPVENRPFCRTIEGKRYRFWITTIVTKLEKDGRDFIGGNNPDITLTELETQRCFYMRPPDPATWVDQLSRQMKLPTGSPLLPLPNGSTGPPTAATPSLETTPAK